MKDNIDILLERRKEIKDQINKLENEYGAIGQVLTELFNYKQKEKEKNYGDRDM